MNSRPRPTCGKLLTIGVTIAAAALISQLRVADARAAEQALPTQVTGLTAVQHDGFTTLAWDAVSGATEYTITRTPVDDAGVPTGVAQAVGVWQAQRTVTPGSPTFADSGYVLGGRYEWRVAASSPTPGLPSDPVSGTTLPQFGVGPGASLRAAWETSTDGTWTSDVDEYSYEAALVAASPRVRMVELGRTNPVASAPTGRPINMLIVGGTPDLTPLPTAREISDSPAILYNCNVHGNEPSGRESCLIMARELAFTEDAHLLEILRHVTVLFVPTINGNGRAANTRGNETGTDLNRDYALITQPETKAVVAMLRDYTPEVALDEHEGDNEDLPILSARHLNVEQSLFDEGKTKLVEGWMYDHAAADGWWMGPYSTGGDSHEGILRNTLALKNIIGMLGETRPDGGTTRPAEATNLANTTRKVYGHLWENYQQLEYYWTRRAVIHSLVEQSIAFNTANVGRVVTRGAYPWPYFPGNGANTALPDTDAVTSNHIIDPPPCGYFLTEDQYDAPRTAGPVALRLGVHGIAQQTRPNGHIVRMAQPQRGLIPTLFDPAAVAPEPLVVGTRLFECPYVTASPRSFSVAADEGTDAPATLAIGNQAVELDQPLEWTITEAQSSCSSPTDLPWARADQTSGTTPSGGGSTNVTLTFSAAGITGPGSRSGLVCLSSNDAGEAEITLPLNFEIRDIFAFAGFFQPVDNPPTLNVVKAGSGVPVKFSLGGNQGLAIFAAGYPQSEPITCDAKAPTSTIGAKETVNVTGRSLTYNAQTNQYTYNWKTDKSWQSTCRRLSLKLTDNTVHTALFKFTK
jgi:hypothetical protein